MLKIFVFICKRRYSKKVKNKNIHFFMENLIIKRKKDKQILNFRSRDLNPEFSYPWFKFLWDVRVMRSNLGKEVRISRLYLHPPPLGFLDLPTALGFIWMAVQGPATLFPFSQNPPSFFMPNFLTFPNITPH